MSLFARNALIAFVITIAILATILYAFNYFNQRRVAELKTIEDQLSLDTLSIETQYALLADAPCDALTEGNILSKEVGGLGDKLAFAEEHLGAGDTNVLRLKERYTLLQIRDYLLTKKIAKSCNLRPVVALYFYSNAGDCPDCDRAGYSLSYLRQTYPALRVYSFDYNLDLSALKTFIAVEKIDPEFPAFKIEGKQQYGFTTLEELEKAFPKSLFATTSTSTKATTTKR